MKNKIIILLMMTVLTGSLLVGCGGTTDNVNTNDNTTKIENGVSNPDTTYVRTDELQAAMEEVEVEEEGKEEREMSAEAKEIFAMFRDKVAENNETREEAQKQYPNMTISPLVEADSPEGLESFGTFYCSLEDKDGLEGLLIAFITQDYNTYYIEYVGESNLGVEINIYGAK